MVTYIILNKYNRQNMFSLKTVYFSFAKLMQTVDFCKFLNFYVESTDLHFKLLAIHHLVLL